jgi:hypothetical protein
LYRSPEYQSRFLRYVPVAPIPLVSCVSRFVSVEGCWQV